MIVYESIPHAYREAFIYDGWAIDGKPALINMILTGREILETNEFSSEAKTIVN